MNLEAIADAIIACKTGEQKDVIVSGLSIADLYKLVVLVEARCTDIIAGASDDDDFDDQISWIEAARVFKGRQYTGSHPYEGPMATWPNSQVHQALENLSARQIRHRRGLLFWAVMLSGVASGVMFVGLFKLVRAVFKF